MEQVEGPTLLKECLNSCEKLKEADTERCD